MLIVFKEASYMGGTKIFVLRIRDVIKIAAIALAGIIALGILAYIFMPRASAPEPRTSTALYIPGTYTASIILNDRPLDVFVTVSPYEIIAVEMAEMYETQRMLFPLFEVMIERVSNEVLFYQSEDIEIRNDFPVTTGILQQAVVAALDQAILP